MFVKHLNSESVSMNQWKLMNLSTIANYMCFYQSFIIMVHIVLLCINTLSLALQLYLIVFALCILEVGIYLYNIYICASILLTNHFPCCIFILYHLYDISAIILGIPPITLCNLITFTVILNTQLYIIGSDITLTSHFLCIYYKYIVCMCAALYIHSYVKYNSQLCIFIVHITCIIASNSCIIVTYSQRQCCITIYFMYSNYTLINLLVQCFSLESDPPKPQLPKVWTCISDVPCNL